MAGRANVKLTFDDFDEISRRVPWLANIKPSGEYLMEDFYYAGGLPALLGQLAQGVRDMVRVSDARMSGTSYGACVLHVAPEAAVGGPLALVQTGDLITLDVSARTLSLNISERAVASRRASWTPPQPRFGRGYGALYSEHITQANEGCDFGFLARPGASPDPDPQ